MSLIIETLAISCFRCSSLGTQGAVFVLSTQLVDFCRHPYRLPVLRCADEALGFVGFAEPVRAKNLLAGMFGRIGDVVAGDGGTLFLATRNGERAWDVAGTNDDVVVRLTPRAR